MAWRSHGENNAGLVEALARNAIISHPRVKEAMLAVDRIHFARDPEEAYRDNPHGIGFGVTMSAPHMHAHCLEVLEPMLRPGACVLDVGSGTGYLTACMGFMVGPQGKCVGIEHVPQLVDFSVKNINKSNIGRRMLAESQVVLFQGDGRLGSPEHAPFDAIHVGAASPEMPEILKQQLKVGGRLVVPVGTYDQSIVQIDRVSDTLWEEENLMAVRYVPLTDLETQLRSHQ
mmetsp:Transcript_39967/g.76444  ORF Transcript_39967/g.76444 Transcript_39967/m.76444 type:complete len:230 (+) Transcript_39967:187-876(+)|eukprot:CAMPEP_0114245068 /NCGR_PEP_ID=MMETSP0058-20121206/11685_1 /TAXON_ID=36894 /ORGANISM="Pyramimonas parkeae, CCMP726" /LENGTH=229 /DNA_ID=CAMNT_0001358069 /DNA_START=160 /DNA_END=849 /DNA_ORIENTATION=+